MSREELAAGLSIEAAIEAFQHDCMLGGKSTLFAPPSWAEPRYDRLRGLLSDPITSEEAEALRGAVHKEYKLDVVIDWLSEGKDSWNSFLANHNKQMDGETRQREAEFEHEHQRRQSEEDRIAQDFKRSQSEPWRHMTGKDVLGVLYSCWGRCNRPPDVNPLTGGIPGGGMGDMVLDGYRQEFAEHFVHAVRYVLAHQAAAHRLSTRPEGLSKEFDQLWRTLPRDTHQIVAFRVWYDYLIHRVNREWNVNPGNAENLLNLREFVLDRKEQDRSKYYFLESTVDEIPKTPFVEISLDYGVRTRGESVRFESPGSAPKGSQLVLRYHVISRLSYQLLAWLGCSLEANGQWLYNADEDAEVVMQPGRQSFERLLTITHSWPLGGYQLESSLWSGACSDTSRSVRLATGNALALHIGEAVLPPETVVMVKSREQQHPEAPISQQTGLQQVAVSPPIVPQVPDIFDAARVRADLERIAGDPSLVRQYVSLLRSKFTKGVERKIVEQYIDLYQTGTRFVKATTEREQLWYDNELKKKGIEANIASLEADFEEQRLRRDQATHRRQHIGRDAEPALLTQGSEDDKKMEAAHDRARRDIAFDIRLSSGRKLTTLKELQKWFKEERNAIFKDDDLTAEEQDEQYAQLRNSYTDHKRLLREDISIDEDD